VSPPAVDSLERHGRPRVLRIISRLNVGGPARHAILLNRGLQERGFETLLVHGAVGDGEGSFDHLVREERIRSLRVPTLGRRLHPLDDIRAFASVWGAMRDFQPDIVHTHTAKAGALGRAAAALHNRMRTPSRRVAVVHTFHGHVLEGYFGASGNRLVRAAERMLSRVTDCTIAISELQRRDLVDRFHVATASRTVVIHLGLRLGDLLSLRPEDRNRTRIAAGYNDEFVVGFVGRLVPIKQVHVLVDAIALVQRELAVRLIITGDGPERASLDARARAAGVGSITTFAGWRDDLVATYAPLDAFALTSKNEGTPVALIEAMAAGVPVLATAVGGVPDVVTDGETGVLTGQSAADVARALLNIARDRAAAAERAAKAREVVGTRYTDTALVEAVAALYDDLLQRNRSGSRAIGARLHEPA
jgi:glycosyltransferase involved in cell wall biosynthesis